MHLTESLFNLIICNQDVKKAENMLRIFQPFLIWITFTFTQA